MSFDSKQITAPGTPLHGHLIIMAVPLYSSPNKSSVRHFCMSRTPLIWPALYSLLVRLTIFHHINEL